MPPKKSLRNLSPENEGSSISDAKVIKPKEYGLSSKTKQRMVQKVNFFSFVPGRLCNPSITEKSFETNKGVMKHSEVKVDYRYPNGSTGPLRIETPRGTKVSRFLLRENTQVLKVEPKDQNQQSDQEKKSSAAKQQQKIINAKYKTGVCCLSFESRTPDKLVKLSDIYPDHEGDETITHQEVFDRTLDGEGFFGQLIDDIIILLKNHFPGYKNLSKDEDLMLTLKVKKALMPRRPINKKTKEEIPDTYPQMYVPVQSYAYLENKQDPKSDIKYVKAKLCAPTPGRPEYDWDLLATQIFEGQFVLELKRIIVKTDSIFVKFEIVSGVIHPDMEDLPVRDFQEDTIESYNSPEQQLEIERGLEELKAKMEAIRLKKSASALAPASVSVSPPELQQETHCKSSASNSDGESEDEDEDEDGDGDEEGDEDVDHQQDFRKMLSS